MKKVIFIECILLFVLAVICYWIVNSFIYSSNLFGQSEELMNLAIRQSDIDLKESYILAAEKTKSDGVANLLLGLLLYVPAFLAVLSTMIIIAVKPLTGIGPLVEKYRAWTERRKGDKAQKRQAQKQEQIAELEKKLNELKKDE